MPYEPPPEAAGAEPVRYAVIGLGWIAQAAVLPAFRNAARNSELAALISGDRAKLDTLGERYGVSATGDYDDLEQILDDGEIDALYVATPNHLHRENTVRAAEAGVHVLCEKPMAANAEDCEAMIAATERNRVKLMIAYRLHFQEANLRAAELVRQGRLGDPRIFSSLNTQQVEEGDIRLREEMGGGTLLDIGIYCINAARYLFAAEPLAVRASASSGDDPRFRQVEEMVTAELRFPGNRLATFTVSFGAATVNEYRVVGTEGDLRVEPSYGFRGEHRHFVRQEDDEFEATYADRDQFGPQLLYFSDCIRANRSPVPSGTEGLVDVRIIDGMRRSLKVGGWVPLDLETPAERPGMDLEIHCPRVEEPEFIGASDPTD